MGFDKAPIGGVVNFFYTPTCQSFGHLSGPGGVLGTRRSTPFKESGCKTQLRHCTAAPYDFPIHLCIQQQHRQGCVKQTSIRECFTADAVRVAFEFFSQRAALGFAIPEWLPTPDNLQYHSAVARLDTAVYGIITDRQQQLAAMQTPPKSSQVSYLLCPNGVPPSPLPPAAPNPLGCILFSVSAGCNSK